MSIVLKPRYLGDLPTYQLAQFGLTLPEGPVHMSIAAQKHAIKKHGDEFYRCAPFLDDVVAMPSQVGQSALHADDGFELIKEINEEGMFVLVSVLIKPTGKGVYLATSAYPIFERQVLSRIAKGHLIHC